MHAQHRLSALGLPARLARYQDQINNANRLLLSQMSNQYDSKLARFEKAQDALLSLDTNRIIARGYAMIYKEGHLVSSTKDLQKGDQLAVTLKDGQIEVEVRDVN